MTERLFCGIEIGGTKIQCAVGTAKGEIVERVRFGVDLDRGADGIRDELARRVGALAKSFPLAGLGIGFGGPVNGTNVITSHQVRGWDDFPLKAWIHDLTGLPVVLENDSKCAGWAEFQIGAASGSSSMVYMNVGSGIGGCFVLAGKLYNGQGLGAAEIGHTWIPLPAGGRMRLELFASGWAFQERLRQHYPLRAGDRLTELAGGMRGKIDGRLAAQAAAEGDELVIAAFREEAQALGTALANVITLLCPQVVVIGGGLALAGEVLLRPLKEALAELVIGAFQGTYAVRLSRLGEDSVIAGALILAGAFLDSAISSP